MLLYLGSPGTKWVLVLAWDELTGPGRTQSPSERLSKPLVLLVPFPGGTAFIWFSGTGKTGSDGSHFILNLLFMPQVLGFRNLKTFSLKLLLSFSSLSGLP